MPSNRDSCIWQEAEEIYKRELNSTPSPVFTLAPLRPIQVNHEIQWATLAPISSITLSHVNMPNELQDK
jgi:hypothetical protein